MKVELQSADRTLHPIESIAISMAFWITLLSASSLYALITLAPRLVELSDLQKQSHEIQGSISQADQEVHHLNRVADAIVKDPDFVSRLAKKEFSLAAQGSVQIQVEKTLNYDARIPSISRSAESFQGQWYDDLLRRLAEPGDLRIRWTWGAFGMFLVAFLFLNEAFFTGNIGRFILKLLANLFQRYRTAQPISDEVACLDANGTSESMLSSNES
ncbi:hypothetical protein [Thalassoglobus sp.]|uniref:hypothetical protein n=1 Tax=Thalassoglobus sp. TaxID=2795869 RepID=UPI003AA96A20